MIKNTKPKWGDVLSRLPKAMWLFAPIEYLGGWWFWLWRASSGVRFAIQWSAAMIVLLGVVGFYLEIENRKEDRSTRNAQLIAEISSLATTDSVNAGMGIGVLMEFLAKEKIPMRGIVLSQVSLKRSTNLKGADLQGSILGGASLIGVNFSHVNMSGSTLTMANAPWANFEEANLSDSMIIDAVLHNANLKNADLTNSVVAKSDFRNANLEGADFTQVDISGADLTNTNINQQQVDRACLSTSGLYQLPKLPDDVELVNTTRCERYR